MSVLTIHDKASFIDQMTQAIMAHHRGEEAQALIDFVSLFYDQYPVTELNGRKVSDVYGASFANWHFVQEKPSKRAKVRVYNPTLEQDGWLSSHTIVSVMHNDMPFLVDSIRMEMNRRNIAIHSVKSTIAFVQRDGAGNIESFRPAQGELAENEQREALVYLEVNRLIDDSALQDLQHCLEDILGDVETVVSDYAPLTAQLNHVTAELKKADSDYDHEGLREASEFLAWLNNHFTFLGYSEYDLVGDNEERRLEENKSKRLGLFRRHGKLNTSLDWNEFNPGMQAFYTTAQLISFSKSSMRSRVHRNAYSDYVVVKRFDEDGHACGESRFIGLFTSEVYTQSPTQIPLIRQKIAEIVDGSGLLPGSHSFRMFNLVIESMPRDELFQSTIVDLSETVTGVAHINERRMVRLFMRQDAYGKFVSCLVYVPRDMFSTRVRHSIQKVISDAIGAIEYEFTTHFSESTLARVHMVFKVDPATPLSYDKRSLEERIAELARSWDDHLLSSLSDNYGEGVGHKLYEEFEQAFSPAYQSAYDARTAVQDIDTLNQLKDASEIAMSFYQPIGSGKNDVRFKVFHLDELLELSDAIPVLERMGLRVIMEHPYRITRSSGQEVYLHDFNLHYDLPVEAEFNVVRDRFQEAFSAIWSGEAESDAFNRLIIGANLSWREVAILRAYARYMKQTRFASSQTFIANTLSNHTSIAKQLVSLFAAYFEPDNRADAALIEAAILESLDEVANLNEDRVIRRYLDMMRGTLRTNYYQNEEASDQHKSYISFKFSPRDIADIPEPRPMFEIFVYSPRVEGVHLRGGKVARGGLRWSDRLEDYRTEVLGLVKAQQVKNSVIVPAGAKGGFVAKRPPSDGGREAFLAEGVECYKIFIQGLLDVTDNLLDGAIVPPRSVVRRDEDDPYLVVAADKGTATFSDIANEISIRYGHWLGDAFASGGSQGYDHKGMGITAKGAWVGVQRHFKEKGVDVQKEDFNVIAIGDMAGDVFGNGMLLSEHIALQAAFNHLHIFIDPTPDVAASFTERKRLFELPRSSWTDYEKELISAGGGVFDRSAKSIRITPQMQKAFDIKESYMTPTDLINALLKAPVDLIWNGGIGTYVKGSSESHAEVGDKANDGLRVNGGDLRCKVFGEGGNLGLTQLGRMEYARNGGACNTDFIDNAAGVDCSDHEVNIKILLDDLVSNGDMTGKQRNQLLADMTDSVSDLVLSNNYRQTQAISLAEYQTVSRMGEYRRLINRLESEGRLVRELENLPPEDVLQERQGQGEGLTRPELSVLISYVKVALKELLADSDIAEDDYMEAAIENAFPQTLRENFKEQIYNHRLRREIIATQVANDMVNNMGITFTHRLMEATGSDAGLVAKAYVAARDIYRLQDYRQQVAELDFVVPANMQFELLDNMNRRVRRAARWLLRHRRSRLNPGQEVQEFAGGFSDIITALPTVMSGEALCEWQERRAELEAAGVPESLAGDAAIRANLYSGLDLVDALSASGAQASQIADVYFRLGEHLGLHDVARRIQEVKPDNYWQAMARESFMDDLEQQMRSLAVSFIRLSPDDMALEDVLGLWDEEHRVLVDRWKDMISELQNTSAADFAMFSVALRELLDLAQASEHCETLLKCELEES
ncbi:NAD-glutamate dehydrogenase [uncultured Pseudoteredinibacter sp.]|uniref:NAD-glutamate dehydrogenase n=1 Tax=uncultured Pseudoteredinibacter sp. TaxID=1641701 RepID=UPI0026240F6D|nr:NAD-glutamate dehydrogenase [uncultured Pseudoteredinibacter sp.]